MTRILVSGSLAYDRIMDFPGYFRDHILPDKLHSLSVSFTVSGVSETFGGCGGNIGYNLALLGEKPEILACAGNDFDKYRTWLKTCGVGVGSIKIISELPTASAYVTTDKANNQITAFNPGAAARVWKGKIPKADLAIVSPSNPGEMRQLPRTYRDLGIPYFYDAGQQIVALSRDDLRGALPGAAALFGNDYEMDLMLQKLGWSRGQLLENVPVVVTTLGERGSRITTRDAEYTIKPVRAEKLVDPTGAGDAYRAGFAKGFLAGLPIEVMGQLASTVAVYAVETQGTQNHRFTTEELRERYHKAYGEKLPL